MRTPFGECCRHIRKAVTSDGTAVIRVAAAIHDRLPDVEKEAAVRFMDRMELRHRRGRKGRLRP